MAYISGGEEGPFRLGRIGWRERKTVMPPQRKRERESRKLRRNMYNICNIALCTISAMSDEFWFFAEMVGRFSTDLLFCGRCRWIGKAQVAWHGMA
jgi:hypothetical protein